MTDSLTQTQDAAQPVEYLAALDTRRAQHIAAAELARRDMAQIEASIAAADAAIVQLIADTDADGLARKRDRRAALIRRLTAARELEELETSSAGRVAHGRVVAAALVEAGQGGAALDALAALIGAAQ